MKKLTKTLALLTVMVAFTAVTFAQGVTESATATATIITPLTITHDVDLAFGNVAVGAGGGTVVLATNSTRTATGDVSFQSTPAGTAARFIVSGLPGQTYIITLPADGVVTISNGANTMAVNGFNSDVASPATLAAGNNNLLVGATLVVNGNQPAGAYSGTFDVTVAYN